MVRGSAAVLAAFAYVLCARWLPDLGHGDVVLALEGALGALAVAACALWCASLADTPWLVVLAAAGAWLAAAALDNLGAGAGATIPEALAWGLSAALFARLTGTPQLLLALPLFVGALDAIASGTAPLYDHVPHTGDLLSLELPRWGGGPAGRIEVLEVVFFTVFAAWARTYRARPVASAVALTGTLAGVAVVEALSGRGLPGVTALAAAQLIVVADRAERLFTAPRDG